MLVVSNNNSATDNVLEKLNKYGFGFLAAPLIVSWPGVVKPGSKCDNYLLIEDFYPSILEMAGIKKYKTVQPIAGISFIPLLKQTGNPSKGRSLFWNMPNRCV